MMSREWFCVILCHMVKLLIQRTMLNICKITYFAHLSINDTIAKLDLLHDNATPHKAICVRDLLRRWRWDVLEQPPYSLDLSPCDYDLIPKLKAPLCGHRFRTRDDIAFTVRRLIMTNFSHGEADGIRRLPHDWQRTIGSFRNWVLWRLVKC